MKRHAFYLLMVVSFLTACVGEDFIEDTVLFDPLLRITNETSGVDSLLTGDTTIYMTSFFNELGKEVDTDVTWTSSTPSVASIDNSGKLIALSGGTTNIEASANGLTVKRLIVVQGFERIEISASSTSLVMGDQLQLSAQYYNRMNVLTNTSLAWRSSNVGAATVDSTGNLIAGSFGSTTITASLNGITSNPIDIDVVNIERVDLSVPDTFLAVGKQLNAMANYFDETGAQVPSTFSWSSSNTASANIDNSGTITGITRGRTRITAVANGVTSNVISIEVIDDTTAAVNVEINSSGTAITIGSALQFSGVVKNINGNILSNEPIQWFSSNTAVLSIDGGGLAKGLSAGSSTITATTVNGKTSNPIVVNVLNLERVELTLSDSIVVVGNQQMASASYFDPTGAQSTATFTWSSSNTAIATIDNSGIITGVSSGRSQITGMTNGIVSNIISIEVIDDTTIAASVNISSTGTSVTVGDDLQFSAVVRNVNGKILPNQLVQWMSSDPVSLGIDANGLTAGLATGSSTVTAASGGFQSNSVNVLVTPMVASPRTGNFIGRGGYTVNGSVTMSPMPNGSLQLNFSGFSSSSGPGLYIYLSNSITGGISIEALSSRTGTFTVNLPANISINDYNYVLIWCQPFGLTFGSALLN